jgi:hypothetical protein
MGAWTFVLKVANQNNLYYKQLTMCVAIATFMPSMEPPPVLLQTPLNVTDMERTLHYLLICEETYTKIFFQDSSMSSANPRG